MLTNTWKWHFRETIFLAIPVCMSNVGHQLVDVADSYFVGQIGTVPQAAIMLSGTFYILALVFAIGMSYGITPLVAEANVKNDKARISQLLKNAFLANFVVCTAMFLLLFFMTPLMRHLDQPAAVVEIAVPFLNVIMFSMIPLSLFFTLKQFAEGLSDTKAAMLISIAANVLNILLNYVLVFGRWGFPEMGVMGSCWATFIARTGMALGMYAYIYFKPSYRDYRPGFQLGSYSKKVLGQLFKMGIPAGLQFAFEVGAFSAAAVFVGWLGERAMAAHRIAMSMAAITYLISSGIGAAAAVRVGNAFGKQDRTEVRRAGYSALLLSLGFMTFAALLFIIFRYKLAFVFNHDTVVTSLAAQLMLVGALFQLSDGAQVVTLGMLRGMQDTIAPTWITLVAYWVVTLPACYIFGYVFNLGAQGIWFGFVIGLSLAAFGLLWRFNRLSKRVVFSA